MPIRPVRLFNRLTVIAAVLGVLLAGGVCAQEKAQPKFNNLFDEFQVPGADPLGGDPLSAGGPPMEAELVPADARAGETVTLRIKVNVPIGSTTYSMDKGFSGRTSIKLTAIEGVSETKDDWKPDHSPKVVDDPVFKQKVEKFYSDVTYSKPFRIEPSAKEVQIAGTVDFQVCNDRNCTPHTETFDIKFTPSESGLPKTAVEPKVYPYRFQERPAVTRDGTGPVELTVALLPESAKPGDVVTLSISLAIDPEWHTYAQTQPEGNAAEKTELLLNTFNGLEPIDGYFKPNQKFKLKVTEIPGRNDPAVHQLYEGTTTWTRKFRVAKDAGGYGVSGIILYQVCTDKNCLPLKEVAFSLGDLTDQRDAGHLNGVPPVEREFEIADNEAAGGLGLYLLYAFLGGLILNVMPCVLPVLAIKILSFVKQAGESRARIFQLNLAYSVGVVGVFLCLATLAAFLEKGWGSLFQSSEFNLIMACVVFAMGLSLLGVFEIPIPGLAGGGGQREGLAGAFLTGVFATFLATPCSGPFMGVTLAWSVRQPTAVIYLVWGVMGLGMASPYLLCGLFPQALKILPKPGAWMVRFKEFSGFALMGAVIFIISYIDMTATIPLLIMLMGIALGLWMVGNLYDVTSHVRHKNTVRAAALLLTVGIVGFGYSRLHPESEYELPWVEFSERTLEESLAKNKTVLIDFTADWCLVCKKNEAYALNTRETKDLVEKHGIVTLYADYTKRSPGIKAWLDKFKSISVPLTVIIPASDPTRPEILRDSYGQADLLKTLNRVVNKSTVRPEKESSGSAPPQTADASDNGTALN